MPDLAFHVDGATVVPFAATPTLAFAMRATANTRERIHTAVLRCQVRIEAGRRGYSRDEQSRMHELFGEPERWHATLRGLLWTHAAAIVPEFTSETEFALHVPASFDFTIAVTKYLDGLRDGVIPLAFLFSGSLFYEGEGGALQVAPISWTAEAGYALPVDTWRALMDAYYPNTAWLSLRRDVFERLHAYKGRHGIPTWEQTLDALLDQAGIESLR